MEKSTKEFGDLNAAPPPGSRRDSYMAPDGRRYSAQGRRISTVDDVFGEIKEGGPNYRDVSPLQV